MYFKPKRISPFLRNHKSKTLCSLTGPQSLSGHSEIYCRRAPTFRAPGCLARSLASLLNSKVRTSLPPAPRHKQFLSNRRRLFSCARSPPRSGLPFLLTSCLLLGAPPPSSRPLSEGERVPFRSYSRAVERREVSHATCDARSLQREGLGPARPWASLVTQACVGMADAYCSIWRLRRLRALRSRMRCACGRGLRSPASSAAVDMRHGRCPVTEVRHACQPHAYVLARSTQGGHDAPSA
jgi:hypothetical protein